MMEPFIGFFLRIELQMPNTATRCWITDQLILHQHRSNFQKYLSMSLALINNNFLS